MLTDIRKLLTLKIQVQNADIEKYKSKMLTYKSKMLTDIKKVPTTYSSLELIAV